MGPPSCPAPASAPESGCVPRSSSPWSVGDTQHSRLGTLKPTASAHRLHLQGGRGRISAMCEISPLRSSQQRYDLCHTDGDGRGGLPLPGPAAPAPAPPEQWRRGHRGTGQTTQPDPAGSRRPLSGAPPLPSGSETGTQGGGPRPRGQGKEPWPWLALRRQHPGRARDPSGGAEDAALCSQNCTPKPHSLLCSGYKRRCRRKRGEDRMAETRRSPERVRDELHMLRALRTSPGPSVLPAAPAARTAPAPTATSGPVRLR